MIDISRLLVQGTAVWPGDTPFQIERMMRLSEGDSVNLTTLTMSAHTGTHVDAPYHFAEDGEAVSGLALEAFWGPAQVITVAREHGALLPEDFRDHDLRLASRLLVRSGASAIDQQLFPRHYVYPGPELADFLGTLGLVLYGTDCPSIDAANSKLLEGHHALLRNGIAILEWLDLSNAADGLYELAALPLKIAGGDGSPVRAVLRELPGEKGWHNPQEMVALE